ncbi:nucleotidyltransferase family protein [Butyricicoccus sp. Marseille-Q5471]|uniref:nucleotidyltransferase family protein n=1 Tax=Butyricicoccus sp. Marseille-Q5471 TaxID=3039493 RepID=UPI0024BCA27E|nr:nucleotidyltransferase family protein [Butyricicoccus sp. Marseille-Q5471]
MLIHMLYLAAGSSRRFGENKLLHEVGGKPLFRHGLDALAEVAAARNDCTLTVVTRFDQIAQAAEACGVRCVFSPDSEKGLSYTIRAGVNALADEQPPFYLLFAVADQPFLSRQTVERLMAETCAAGTAVASVYYHERPGNPTLLHSRLIPELLALTDDEGGRKVIGRHMNDCTIVQAEAPAELADFDVPDDLHGL